MRVFHPIEIENITDFKTKVLHWANSFECCCYFDSNGHLSENNSFDLIVAVGCKKGIELNSGNVFESLKKFQQETNDFLFGYFSYDLKNETEKLSSDNFDGLNFPEIFFFQPDYLIRISNGKAEIGIFGEKKHAEKLIADINSGTSQKIKSEKFEIKQRVDKTTYLKNVNTIKEHIRKGDVYEMNYCIEFFAENAIINPSHIYKKLNEVSQTPLSCFCRFGDKYLISASPERFLKKTGNKIISQPIKGTAKRGITNEEDEKIKNELRNNSKEQSENVMIVDLVRNDLSRSAKNNSVTVDELFGVYTFRQVHQMISTVTAEIKDDIHFIEAIKNAFPMGSMTGAPKVKAMELIEKFEATKRGLYSGTVGYISPDRDFDFNVVIRSILYNETKKYLSFMVGSAITDKADAKKEYEECLLKAKALFEVLEQNL